MCYNMKKCMQMYSVPETEKQGRSAAFVFECEWGGRLPTSNKQPQENVALEPKMWPTVHITLHERQVVINEFNVFLPANSIFILLLFCCINYHERKVLGIKVIHEYLK